LVLLAIDDRRVEIETGYGVEGMLPGGCLTMVHGGLKHRMCLP
jgi:hypothetical protein